MLLWVEEGDPPALSDQGRKDPGSAPGRVAKRAHYGRLALTAAGGGSGASRPALLQVSAPVIFSHQNQMRSTS